MATKNLVPRVNNEGSLGVSSRKWANAYFTNGNFDKVLTDELKNISDNELLVAGDNITISDNTISTNLIFQLDGVTQNASTANFIQNNALLSNGILNISRLTHYDKISFNLFNIINN